MTAYSTIRKLGVLCAVVFLSAGCRGRPEVRVVPVTRAHVEATVSSVNSGTVRAERITELAFGTVGRVQEVNAKLGDLVRKGEILAQVENDDLKSRLQSAQEEYERSQRLSKSDAMSQSGVTQARAAYDTAVTAYEKSLIKAPYDGVIAELNLEVGELSQITAVIFRGVVRKVVPFVSSIREQDRTSEIELTIDNEGILLPAGASADVEVITETKEDVLTISSKALLGRGGDRYAYVLVGSKLKRTPVKIGIYGYTVSEVLSGLSQSDEVVMPSDKFELVDGLRVKVLR